MRIMSVALLSLLPFFSVNAANHDSNMEPSLRLWYDKPAERWEQALPVGNGRLGGMVFGGTASERIQLNEESVWAGPPIPEPKPGVYDSLQRARQLFFEGKYAEADRELETNFLQPEIGPRSYQTLGDLRLNFTLPEGEVSGYRRQLDLNTAVASTSFRIGDTGYTREVFTSPVDQVLAVRLEADKPGSVSVVVSLDRPADFETVAIDNTMLFMSGRAGHGGKHLGTNYAAVLLAGVENGTITAEDDTLKIENADVVTLYLAAATDYNKSAPEKPLQESLFHKCAGQIRKAADKTYAALLEDHIREHQRLFKRVTLDLGGREKRSQPTDQRLDALRQGADDPDLTALYFQYGRYLLISSSRPGDLPANLQGIWNEHIRAPWNADYHININIQMNYWPAEVCNLSECHEPFFDFVERLVPSGRRTAQECYRCRGFVAHYTSDVWHWTAPIGRVIFGMWPMGAGWCTRHFMEHYRFTGDREFLRDRAYPILKESALFFLDFLVKDPDGGQLVAGPCNSPENAFLYPGGRAYADMGASMSQEIVWDVFTNTLEAAKVLGIEDDFTTEVAAALDNLKLPQIASDGRLMEWSHEFGEAQPGHRHMSHLFGMHPGRQFTYEMTPDIMTAARKSIDYRLARGGGHTGWSRAWIINFQARLLESEKAHENILALLSKSTHPNLFDDHPPFQIDGNFGAAAAVAEMLLQSHAGQIHLLPALPAAWPDGRVTGLCARGGFVVDMEWSGGKLAQAKITSKNNEPCRIRYGDTIRDLKIKSGESYTWKPEG